MNLPFSRIPANTSFKLHIFRKTPSIDKIIVHIAFVTSHIIKKNMTVANSAFWWSSELTSDKTVSEKTVVIFVLWSMAFIFMFIFKNKLNQSLRKKSSSSLILTVGVLRRNWWTAFCRLCNVLVTSISLVCTSSSSSGVSSSEGVVFLSGSFLSVFCLPEK